MNYNNRLSRLLTGVSSRLERFGELTGRAIAWLVLALVLLVGFDVAMRYFFRSGSIALQEFEWHLFSVIFLFGAAYTLKHDDHVRLDLVYRWRRLNDYRRAWINVIGGILFLAPFCLLIIISSWPFVSQSFLHAEGSPDPGGLPYRWLLKSAIPLGFALLLLQGIADIAKNLARILGARR